MFSEGWLQEILALIVAGGAAVFLVMRFVGPPTKKRSTRDPSVTLGPSLARGLNTNARRQHVKVPDHEPDET